MRALFFLSCLLIVSSAIAGVKPDMGGEVRVPLSDYQNMLNLLHQETRPSPAAYAIGKSTVTVEVIEVDDRVSARIDASFTVETFEDEWTLVPILPSGVALAEVSADGRPIQLVQGPEGLAWTTNKSGTVTMRLSYGIDASRSQSGFVLPVVVPRAAATELSVVFPATGLDAAVIPSADLQRTEQDGATRLTASVPATSSILISWRTMGRQPYVVSRAQYSGALQGQALAWTASFDVEIFSGESVVLPLMPRTVTLTDISVDDRQVTVLEEAGRFATIIQGRGMHHVQVTFQTPILRGEGPPHVRVQVPQVPVSRFELTLPGRKDVRVLPHANVVTTQTEDQTQSTVFMPMRDQVEFFWVEAIPAQMRGKVRSNAAIYHAIHAEEGVLHGRATVVYEITHGETNRLELSIPDNVQVNRITAPTGGISDWVVTRLEDDHYKKLDVFLDRPVRGEYRLQVEFERLVGHDSARPDADIDAPLLTALNVSRQRGMVALLAGSELALRPVTEERVSRVGENQLPAFVRNELSMTVAHTYKYTEAPKLVVEAVAPERKQGKFDAQVDTLISIGEVALKGSATVEVNVKSGSISDLNLQLPSDINVLGVSSPSLRSHQIRTDARGQSVDLAFTQEMQGQFRVEVTYERIIADEASDAAVPTLSVGGAEVEHGRIAVEALTAVEVRATTVAQLSSVDINELPQQLVLKTTNPILLAYKYVHAPYRLELRVTRHEEIDVQVAAIESASYRTLFTRDGFAVTTATLIVRNSRQQFLRLELPPDSQIWSVFVDGNPEKPAQASEDSTGNGSSVLIKMINSSDGFPVEMVYATQAEKMRFLGTVSARLPEPDMVVTRTHWDVFLPTGPRYQSPQTTLDLLVDGTQVNPQLGLQGLASSSMIRSAEASETPMGQPLRLSVPTRGVHFAFEKLYANQSPEDATFSIRYTSVAGNRLALWASAIGILLLWFGILALGGKWLRISRGMGIISIVGGVTALIAAIGPLGASPVLASGLTLLVAMSLGIWLGAQRVRRWRVSKSTTAQTT